MMVVYTSVPLVDRVFTMVKGDRHIGVVVLLIELVTHFYTHFMDR